MHRYSLAANQLLMVAPRELLEAVQRVNELLKEFEGPDQGWIEEWQEARGQLVRTCRDIVGPEAS